MNSYAQILVASLAGRERAHHLEGARAEERDIQMHLALLGWHQNREVSKHAQDPHGRSSLMRECSLSRPAAVAEGSARRPLSSRLCQLAAAAAAAAAETCRVP